MKEVPNGEQSAFPTMHAPTCIFTGGLTKRELFAAMAMQGLCAIDDGDWSTEIDAPGLAQNAIAIGDALLAGLEKKP